VAAETFTRAFDQRRRYDASREDARPGVELVGPVTDRVGRQGVAVAFSESANRDRHELIFDPRTSALLEEEYVLLDGNAFGYPAATVIGCATYVSTGVVKRLGARP
jgi:hypothetical protein